MNKKKNLIYLILLLFMFCYGFMSHRYEVFPYQIIKLFTQTLFSLHLTEYDKIRNEYKNWNKLNDNFKKISIKKYYPGLNIFSDRHYFNHRNDEKLKGLYLVQIPRHYQDDIYLNVFNDIFVYRVLCEKNNKNEEYINWEKENYKLLIIGADCIHTEIVKKKFKKGIIKISSGGPNSSNPIFVYNSKSSEQIFQLYDKL